MTQELPPLLPDLALARRDELGFLETTPSLSAEQVTWLTYRMGTETDREAMELAGVSRLTLNRWQRDLGFQQCVDLALSNKREGFRLIGAQLLPVALRTLQKLYRQALEEGDVSAARTALNMHLRSQALLIDRTSNDETNKMDQLLTLLRQPARVQVLDMPPRP